MNDLISREEAIDTLEENKEMINAALDSLTLDYNARRNLEQRRGQINEDIETIKELPSAQQRWKPDEWCTDCKEYDHERNCCPRFNHVIRKTLEEQQKTGQWIEETDRKNHWHCSECGEVVGLAKAWYKYCYNCGAKMESDNE